MAAELSGVQRRPHLELDTPLNIRMSIRSADEDRQFWCTFVGLERNRALLIRLDKELGSLAIPGNRVIVKYILENLVFGFMTTVIGKILKPIPLLVLEYPQSVETLDLRRDNRAICFLPATIYREGEEYQAHILDISSSGCRVAADLPTGLSLADLEVNESVFSQFNLDGRDEIYAKCAVRNVFQNDSKLCIGFEFMEIPEDIALRLETYALTIQKLRIGCS